MGVYSANRVSSFGGIDPDTIVANENYTNTIDAELILIESHQNDMAIFEAVLANDFAEAVAMNEGTLLESELSAITEGSVGDFFNKIKEFLKKVWEKIKGIFKAFMVKLTSVITKDNKEFVNKYKADVLKKDLSKMKYKYAKPIPGAAITVKDDVDEALINSLKGKSAEEVNKIVEDRVEDDKLLEDLLSASIGDKSTSAADYAKDAHEHLYEDVEEEEGLPTSLLSTIISELTTAKDSIKKVTDEQKRIDKIFSDKIKNVERRQKEIVAGYSDIKDDKMKAANKAKQDNKMAQANAEYKIVQVFQNAATKAVAAELEGVKYGIKQFRAIFAKAAAYNPKAKNESAVLEEAVYEAAEYEVESLFDCYA
jgi:hypothetical protein